MSSLAELAGTEEAGQFAATVAAIVSRHAGPDPWRPGAATSDASRELEQALDEAGWNELGRDETLLPLAGPAGAALGRAFASLAPVDALLGGALKVGELARYAREGAPLAEPRSGQLARAEAARAVPLPYTDALGVARVESAAAHSGGAVPAEDAPPGAARVGAGEAPVRMAAWCAASVGYLAGLCEEALRLALEHARSRRAFGGPLSALEPVQQMLADAATLADGLTLLTAERPGLDALAHAGDAAERAVAICMQVTGALGFTLEFPLQRAYRRSRSARAWADAAIAAWDGGGAEVAT
jgi:3-oxo-4-pregnene-20-carboxyl-CoA dehydrogenase alpha subunit